MPETRLSLKEMCARFEVTPRTLRYYEYIELIRPEREGRVRWYGPREIARTTLILRGRRWGFSLEEVRQWLLIYDQQGTEVQMREWVRLADRRITALHSELGQLKAVIEELESTRDKVARSLPRVPSGEDGATDVTS